MSIHTQINDVFYEFELFWHFTFWIWIILYTWKNNLSSQDTCAYLVICLPRCAYVPDTGILLLFLFIKIKLNEQTTIARTIIIITINNDDVIWLASLSVASPSVASLIASPSLLQHPSTIISMSMIRLPSMALRSFCIAVASPSVSLLCPSLHHPVINRRTLIMIIILQ